MTSSIVPQNLSNGDFQIFMYDAYPIRVKLDEHDEAIFIAADVCAAVDIINVSQAVGRLDDDERGIYSIDTPGGKQQVAIVTEPGLYSLIGSSRKPSAKSFRRYINHEVLPALRKTGVFIAKPMTPAEMLVAQAQALLDHERRMLELEAQVERIKDTYEADRGAPQMMTIVAYVTYRKLHLSSAEISAKGKAATRYSNQHGYPIEKIAHKVWGNVNAYHIDVLREVFKQRSMFEGK